MLNFKMLLLPLTHFLCFVLFWKKKKKNRTGQYSTRLNSIAGSFEPSYLNVLQRKRESSLSSEFWRWNELHSNGDGCRIIGTEAKPTTQRRQEQPENPRRSDAVGRVRGATSPALPESRRRSPRFRHWILQIPPLPNPLHFLRSFPPNHRKFPQFSLNFFGLVASVWLQRK